MLSKLWDCCHAPDGNGSLRSSLVLFDSVRPCFFCQFCLHPLSSSRAYSQPCSCLGILLRFFTPWILPFFSLNCWVPSNHGTRHRFGSHWEVQTNRVSHLFAKSSQIDRWAPTILTITQVICLYHSFRSGFSWMFFVRFVSTPSCDPRVYWERKQKLVLHGTVLRTGDWLVGIEDVCGYMATGQIAGDERFASMVSVIALHRDPLSGWSSIHGMVGFPNSPAIISLPADP